MDRGLGGYNGDIIHDAGYVGSSHSPKKGYKANHFMGIVYQINDPYFMQVIST